MMSDFLILWILSFRPFEEPFDNALEAYNEFTIAVIFMIIIGGFLCTAETGSTPDVMTRKVSEEVGYIIIGVIILSIVINASLFAWSVYTNVIRRRIKKCGAYCTHYREKYCPRKSKKEPEMKPEEAKKMQDQLRILKQNMYARGELGLPVEIEYTKKKAKELSIFASDNSSIFA